MALPQEANGELSYSLTSNYYTDPAIFAAERERIFFRTWQRVGHGSQATAPGDYFTCDVLGQELVVLRGEDGALRAFHNVCQHRAHRLLEGAGNVRVIACPYHAWTYKLDGALSYAPNSENVPGFDGAKICLAEVQLEMFCNFVFVNLDAQATPLAETVPGLEDEIRSYLPDCDDLVLAHRTEATYDANWKVAVENYSECYHCDLNHPTLMKGVLDAGGYRIELHERYQKHASAIQPDANRSYDFDRTRTPRGGEFGAWYLWPNCSFQAYPGGYLNIFKWFPLGVEKTRCEVDWYLSSATPDKVERELIDQHAAYTFAEDEPLINAVQKGMHSMGYDRGPVMVEDTVSYRGEHSIAHIQSLVRRALDG